MTVNYDMVADNSALTAAIRLLRTSSFVAVDTEFIRRDTFYPLPGLLQLADENHCFLVDPLAINDFGPLTELLTAPQITKIMHSCSEDLEVFRHMLDVVPAPLFDTQVAAGYCSLGFGLGYQRVIEQLLGVALDKGETQSDWLRRPLSEAQLGYAAADVYYLPAAVTALQNMLQTSGRAGWFEEDCLALVNSARENKGPSTSRVKGAGALSRRQLALLQMILDWRENKAMRLDKPRTWILSDKQCLIVSRALDASENTLREAAAAGRGRPDRVAADMTALVDASNALPESELPAVLPGRPSAEATARIKTMKQHVAKWAEEWQVAPELLLRRRDYELIAHHHSINEVSLPAHLSGWRRSALIEPLMDKIA